MSRNSCNIEGSAKNAVITDVINDCISDCITDDHVTLCHFPTQKSVGRRHAIWLNALSPYLAFNPQRNQLVLKILNRKGSSNEADALSRRL
jgi:hypothetical protein